MDIEHIAGSVLKEDALGPIGVGLWRSPLKQLSTPPWAPRRDFAAVSGGKAPTGWRNIWVLGGDDGRPLNDIWRSVDGGGSWDKMDAGPRWCPRSRLAVCGAATDPSKGNASSRPIGIMYVVGGHASSGLLDDVWASDTAGRFWTCMSREGPFGPRCDVACACVPPDPTCLVVAGGFSIDYHRDVWLSRDSGETFSQVETQESLPPCCTLLQHPPSLLCAARSNIHGPLVFWHLRFEYESDDDTGDAGSQFLKNSAVLEALDEDSESSHPHLESIVLRPPHVTIDVELSVALNWDSRSSCLRAANLHRGSQDALIDEVSVPQTNLGGKNVHIICDMDAANVGWDLMRHGRIWILADDGSEVWATGRGRFFEQENFMKLLGVRLSNMFGIPRELWVGRVRPLLLPFRVQRGSSGPPRKFQPSPKAVSSVEAKRGDLGTWKVVHEPRVAIRSKPSLTANIVGARDSSVTLSPVAIQDGWLCILLNENRLGWMLIDGAAVGLGTLLARVDLPQSTGAMD